MKCLYCGTSLEVQPKAATNCVNCGGPLPGRYVPKREPRYYDWSSGEEPYDYIEVTRPCSDTKEFIVGLRQPSKVKK